MKGLRLLNNGQWNKPPVLLAARRILFAGLAKQFPLRALGDAAEFLNGTSYDTGKVFKPGSYPIIRISNITDPASPYLRTDEELPERFWITQGDLLVSWSASFKSILWTGPEGYLNQHIFKVSERPGFIRSFIRHAIEASFEEMQENVVGIGMMHLRRADFLGHQIPCPPIEVQQAVARYLDWLEGGGQGGEPNLPEILAEQRRIVARIEVLAAKIAEARSLRQQATEEVEAIVLSLLHRFFVVGSTKWKSISMDQAIEINDKQVDPTLPENSQLPHISGENMESRTCRLLPWRTAEADGVKSNNYLFSPGTILYSKIRPYLRKAVFVDFRGVCSADVYPIRVRNSELDPHFVKWALVAEPFTNYANRLSGRTRMPKLNRKQLFGFELAYPSVHEQQRIVSELQESQAKVDALKRLQTETAAKLDALLPAILDRAFKGELL